MTFPALQRCKRTVSAAWQYRYVTGALLTLVVLGGILLFDGPSLAASALKFGLAHPRFLGILHVSFNAIPDIAYALLALAGLSYLIPVDKTERIQKSRRLRWSVSSLLIGCCLAAIIVNAIKAEEQEKAAADQDLRMNSVKDSVAQVLTFLASERGTKNEAERRRQTLEALRGEYITSHPDAPGEMISGALFPPADWINKRLREQGENWTYRPSSEGGKPPVSNAPAPAPPVAELELAVGDDDATNIVFDSPPGVTWYDRERHCFRPFRCYPQRDIDPSSVIDLNVGAKGWARAFFTVFNIGGSAIYRPDVAIDAAGTHDVSVSRVNQRQAYTVQNRLLEFSAGENRDIQPFRRSKTGYDFATDISIGPTIDRFTLKFKIFADNLEAKEMIVTFRVAR